VDVFATSLEKRAAAGQQRAGQARTQQKLFEDLVQLELQLRQIARAEAEAAACAHAAGAAASASAGSWASAPGVRERRQKHAAAAGGLAGLSRKEIGQQMLRIVEELAKPVAQAIEDVSAEESLALFDADPDWLATTFGDGQSAGERSC
jgi:hypothetical protein